MRKTYPVIISKLDDDNFNLYLPDFKKDLVGKDYADCVTKARSFILESALNTLKRINRSLPKEFKVNDFRLIFDEAFGPSFPEPANFRFENDDVVFTTIVMDDDKLSRMENGELPFGDFISKHVEKYTIDKTKSFFSLIDINFFDDLSMVNKTVTVPSYLNDLAKKNKVNFSEILTNGLIEELL